MADKPVKQPAAPVEEAQDAPPGLAPDPRMSPVYAYFGMPVEALAAVEITRRQNKLPAAVLASSGAIKSPLPLIESAEAKGVVGVFAAPQGMPHGVEAKGSTGEVAGPPRTAGGSTSNTPVVIEVPAASLTISGGRPTVILTPPNWATEREEALRRLDAVEPLLRRLVPILEEIEAERGRGGIGHNRPPEPIEPLPLDVPQIAEGIAAINVYRTELSSETPRFDVIELCGFAIKRLASAVAATLRLLLKGIITGTGTLIATEIFLKLEPQLSEIANQIQHWLHLLH